MQNAIAVYTSKSSLKGRQLEELAAEGGIQVRFLALGGFLWGDVNELKGKTLIGASGGTSKSALLLVGAFETDLLALAQFDDAVSRIDRKAIAGLLNGGELPWIELYTSRFNYAKETKSTSDRAAVDGSVKKNQIESLKSAKIRYIIYNQARRKNGGQLMKRLAEILVAATDGVAADFRRPGR